MRIELTHKGFADLSLTTWVPRRSSYPTAFLRRNPELALALPFPNVQSLGDGSAASRNWGL